MHVVVKHLREKERDALFKDEVRMIFPDHPAKWNFLKILLKHRSPLRTVFCKLKERRARKAAQDATKDFAFKPWTLTKDQMELKRHANALRLCLKERLNVHMTVLQ